MVIFSSTGEFESRNLMQSSSDLMPAMPTIFTSRNWPNKHFQWSLSQKSVTGPTTACSSGRAYMESRIYKKPIISPCSGIRYKLIRQFFFLPFLSFFISFFFFVLRKKNHDAINIKFHITISKVIYQYLYFLQIGAASQQT